MWKQSALRPSVKRKAPVNDPLVELASSAKREVVKVEKENASALSFILGEEEEELEEDLEMEIAMYFTEKPSRRGTDHLVWSEGNAACFPKLAALAKLLLSVPSNISAK